jgi:hypothetical protein
MCPRPRPQRGRVSFCDRVRTCRRWDCINVRQRERAKKARCAACTSLLTSPATRRMPPKCGAFPVQPRRSRLRQTACWSKPDSNCQSHLLEDMELSIASVRMKLPTLYASGRALPAGRLHRHQPDGAEPERIDALCNQRANSGSKKAKGATYPTFAVNGVRLQLHVLEQAEGQSEATPSSDQCEPPRSRACWMDGVERLPIITG